MLSLNPETSKEIDRSWPSPTAFVDSISYVAKRRKTHFGTVCCASVLICPRVQCHDCLLVVSPPTMADEQSISLRCLCLNLILWPQEEWPILFMRYNKNYNSSFTMIVQLFLNCTFYQVKLFFDGPFAASFSLFSSF